MLGAAVDLAFATAAAAQRRHLRVPIVDAQDPAANGVDELTLLRDMPEAMRTGALTVDILT